MAGLELEECPECGDLLTPFSPPQPMPSGFTDQVVVCTCGWVGAKSEISSKPVQLTFPDFAKLAGKGVDKSSESVV